MALEARRPASQELRRAAHMNHKNLRLQGEALRSLRRTCLGRWRFGYPWSTLGNSIAQSEKPNGLKFSSEAPPRACLRFSLAQFTVEFTIHTCGCPLSHSFPRPFLRWLFLSFLAWAIAAAAHAQLPDAPPPASTANVDPWAAPDFSVNPKTLYEAVSAVPVPDGANVVELVEDESYTFDDSGRMNHVGRVIYKVLTQKGAENWDSLSVSWEPWHEARPVIHARVIEPGFTVHELDPNTVTEAPARGGDYKTYSDGKRLRAPFPAIAPGVVVEEEYAETETEPLFAPGRVGRVELGQEDVMVEHSRVVFDAPASLPLQTQLFLLPDVKQCARRLPGA